MTEAPGGNTGPGPPVSLRAAMPVYKVDTGVCCTCFLTISTADLSLLRNRAFCRILEHFVARAAGRNAPEIRPRLAVLPDRVSL